jgi:hypothetical protein
MAERDKEFEQACNQLLATYSKELINFACIIAKIKNAVHGMAGIAVCSDTIATHAMAVCYASAMADLTTLLCVEMKLDHKKLVECARRIDTFSTQFALDEMEGELPGVEGVAELMAALMAKK